MSPTVPRVPRSIAPCELVQTILDFGAAIIEGYVDADVALGIEADLSSVVAERTGGFRPGHDDFYGSQTVRVQNLIRHSTRWRESILNHPLHHAVADAVLLAGCGDYWMSQSELIYLGPGQAAQTLHADDINWSLAASIPGIELQVACLVALGDYDKAVGATRVVPGSHRWEAGRVPQPHEVLSVELAPGDAMMYLGSTVHGGGENTTSDRWRKALYISFLVGWLTPEEAVALSIPDDVVASLTDRERRLLGWSSIPGRVVAPGEEADLAVWQLDAQDPKMVSGHFCRR